MCVKIYQHILVLRMENTILTFVDFNSKEIMKLAKILESEFLVEISKQCLRGCLRGTDNNNIITQRWVEKLWLCLVIENIEVLAFEGWKPRCCIFVLSLEYHARGACFRPTMLCPTYRCSEVQTHPHIQVLALWTLPPLEHHEETHSICPICEGSILVTHNGEYKFDCCCFDNRTYYCLKPLATKQALYRSMDP
jgi:hypothetical protein